MKLIYPYLLVGAGLLVYEIGTRVTNFGIIPSILVPLVVVGVRLGFIFLQNEEVGELVSHLGDDSLSRNGICSPRVF